MNARERTVATAITLEPTSRDFAAYRRRLRSGRLGSVPVQARNGLPVLRPYAYRGTGTDQYLGTYGSTLDQPYWDGQP